MDNYYNEDTNLIVKLDSLGLGGVLATPSSFQCLLLALCSEVNPDFAGSTICWVGDLAGHMKSKCPAYCNIAPN